MSESVHSDNSPKAALAVAERYAGAVNYLYPLLINVSHKHRIVRDLLLSALFDQDRLIYEAAKSGQISRLYVADAGLAHIKSLLRFMADPARKLVSRRQYEVASVHLAETGAMLGTWIRHAQNAMRLRFSHWSVQPAAAGVNFCGYRIWPTHKLLRKSSVQRARRKLARFAVDGDFIAKTRFLGAWLGHARHANAHHLLTNLGVEK